MGGPEPADVAALEAKLSALEAKDRPSVAATVATATASDATTPIARSPIAVLLPEAPNAAPATIPDSEAAGFVRSRDLITTSQQFQSLLDLIAKLPPRAMIGLDTEFMAYSTYRPQLELVQIAFRNPSPSAAAAVASSATAEPDVLAFAIDARALRKELPLFVRAIADKECVFHGCRADLEVLSNAFTDQSNTTAPAPALVFDTQIAASFIGLGARMSYGKLLKDVLNVKLDKGQTMSDWSRRPLSDTQLAYALNDVRYLPRVCIFHVVVCALDRIVMY